MKRPLISKLKSKVSRRDKESQNSNEGLLVNEFNKKIFDTTFAAIIITNLKGVIIYANSVFYKYTGCSNQEVIKKHFLKLPTLMPNQLFVYKQFFLNVLKGNRLNNIELQYKAKNGEIKTGEVEFGPMKKEGKIVGLLAIIRDITEKKNAQSDSMFNDQRLYLALDSSGGGVWEWDIKKNKIYLSKNIEEASGYSLEYFSNSFSDWVQKIHPDDLEKFNSKLNQELKGLSEGFFCDIRFLIKGEEYNWIAVRGKVVLRSKLGKPLRILGTILDINDKKKAEETIDIAFSSLDNARECIFWVDSKGRFINSNKTVEEKLGYTKEEFINMYVWEIDPNLDREKAREIWKKIKNNELRIMETAHMTKEGKLIPFETSFNMVNFNGQDYVFVYSIDLAQKREYEKRLTISEEKYKKLVENMFDGIWQINSSGKTVFVNKQMAGMLGHKPKEMVGSSPYNYLTASMKNKFEKELSARKDGSGKSRSIYNFINSTGLPVYLMMELMPLYNEGEYEGAIIYASDNTEKVRMEEELKLKESAIETSINAITIFDLNMISIYVNTAFIKMFGYDNKSEVLGKRINEFIDFDSGVNMAIVSLFENGSIFGEFRGIKKEGSSFDIAVNANLVKKGSQPEAVMFSMGDITEKKISEDKIKFLSFHDSLTGLYNRAYFEEELKRIDTARQLPLSFIIGDLNSLKLVNDSYGHHFGDSMLIRAAKIIRKFCREEDVVARWGGDEFMVLLPHTSQFVAEAIIERMRRACNNHTYRDIPLSIALGSATKSEPGQNIRSVILKAENNMYKRKLLERKSISGSIILSLEATLSEKSYETREHTERIKKMAVKLGRELKLSENQINELSLLATLHDIGKVAIPESILVKNKKLNKKEWELIKRHTEIGYNIAESSPQIIHIADSILAAHERWDGAGYPKGLREEEIPITSRIIHIIDAYDVMRNGRPYKRPLGKARAIAELIDNAGTQFDPLLVDKFIQMIDSSKRNLPV